MAIFLIVAQMKDKIIRKFSQKKVREKNIFFFQLWCHKIGPFFFENKNGETQTVNNIRYLKILYRKCLLSLKRRGINPNEIWFQQDGTTLHTIWQVTDRLHQTLDGNFISFKTANVWAILRTWVFWISFYGTP